MIKKNKYAALILLKSCFLKCVYFNIHVIQKFLILIYLNNLR